MIDCKDLLTTLISTPGLSGYEAPVRQVIAETWEPLCDRLSVSRLGSLHALKSGQGEEPRPAILLAAHMDAIGLMVASVEGEFLRLSAIGGLDARVLPGQPVVVHGRRALPGVIVQPPKHLLPPTAQDGPVPLEYLLVDVGLSARQVRASVKAGDLISFAQPPVEMGENLLAGPSLDNRASVVALTHCLELLQQRVHAWDVWAVATAQEEETLGGAATSAFDLQPDLAIAVDVTWAQGPGTPKHKAFPLGKGIPLGWGPNIHPGLHRAVKEVAERLEIPVHLEPMPRHSGTDAYALQTARQGIPTLVVSIPLRYMHTPVEMVDLRDIRRAGRLLAEFIAGLETEFLKTLVTDSAV